MTVDQKPIVSKIKYRWVQSFMQVDILVILTQTGKLMVGLQKQEMTEKAIEFHLKSPKRAFNSKSRAGDLISNANETQFIFKINDGRKIGLCGEEDVKFADVVGG